MSVLLHTPGRSLGSHSPPNRLLPVLAPTTARLNLTYFLILLINTFKGRPLQNPAEA